MLSPWVHILDREGLVHAAWAGNGYRIEFQTDVYMRSSYGGALMFCDVICARPTRDDVTCLACIVLQSRVTVEPLPPPIVLNVKI